MAMTAGQIAAEARAAGLAGVQVRRCGERIIAPALRLTAQRLENATAAPAGQAVPGRARMIRRAARAAYSTGTAGTPAARRRDPRSR